MSIELAKKAAAGKAISYIRDEMVVGLGTGSTANLAVRLIGEMVVNGLTIRAVPTSKATEALAVEQGIPLLAEFGRVDLTIDGADEVDNRGNLIKGGGGALAREKIVAAASEQEIIIIDQSKLVSRLGEFPLPVEVLPFGWNYVQDRIQTLGAGAILRRAGADVFLTDNHNYILDCQFRSIENPNELTTKLNLIPGVVENGLFVGLAYKVIVGRADGSTEEIDF